MRRVDLVGNGGNTETYADFSIAIVSGMRTQFGDYDSSPLYSKAAEV